jgi:hypothetical protein
MRTHPQYVALGFCCQQERQLTETAHRSTREHCRHCNSTSTAPTNQLLLVGDTCAAPGDVLLGMPRVVLPWVVSVLLLLLLL